MFVTGVSQMTQNNTLQSTILRKDPHHPISIYSAVMGCWGPCTDHEELWLHRIKEIVFRLQILGVNQMIKLAKLMIKESQT